LGLAAGLVLGVFPIVGATTAAREWQKL